MDDDIVIQVLTQSREHLIKRTFESIIGAKQAIVHFYNSTSEQQRRIVFKKDKPEIKKIALDGARLIKELSKDCDTDIRIEYSPESFTATEMDFALEICEEVMNVWQPTPEKKAIINLPATVELTTPNVYADQIEWFSRNISCRDSIILSVHPIMTETGVAASELGILAGADRVEGTLFGNGERTGNVDIINLAMNLYSQGINPELNVNDMDNIIRTYEECTGMCLNERHPYAGELVYTAFQALIRMYQQRFQVFCGIISRILGYPISPIDPTDIGSIMRQSSE